MLFGHPIYIVHIILFAAQFSFLTILSPLCHLQHPRVSTCASWISSYCDSGHGYESFFKLIFFQCLHSSESILLVWSFSFTYPFLVVRLFFSLSICIFWGNILVHKTHPWAVTSIPLANYSFPFSSESFAIVFSGFPFLECLFPLESSSYTEILIKGS